MDRDTGRQPTGDLTQNGNLITHWGWILYFRVKDWKLRHYVDPVMRNHEGHISICQKCGKSVWRAKTGSQRPVRIRLQPTWGKDSQSCQILNPNWVTTSPSLTGLFSFYHCKSCILQNPFILGKPQQVGIPNIALSCVWDMTDIQQIFVKRMMQAATAFV